jgi:hypothetical protein
MDHSFFAPLSLSLSLQLFTIFSLFSGGRCQREIFSH